MGINGDVLALVLQADGKMIVGGHFDYECANWNSARGIVRLDTSGSADADCEIAHEKIVNGVPLNANGFSGQICALALQPDGKIVVGGSFSSYNEKNVLNVCRINGDRSLDDAGFMSVEGR